jgi:hypothetical protein
MIETYYTGAYWLARPEPAEACARRAEAFFQLLGRCDPAWVHGYEAADSFEEARKLRLATDVATLERLFQRKENQLGGGVRYWLWTGDNPEETTGISGTCGLSGTWMPSVCLLKPPSQGTVSERVLSASVMAEVLRAMALAWGPEWGVATSHAHRDMVLNSPEIGTSPCPGGRAEGSLARREGGNVEPFQSWGGFSGPGEERTAR